MSLRSWIVAVLLAFATYTPLEAGPLRYRIEALELLPGSFRGVATDINDLGQVVGYVDVAGNSNIANSRPVIWDRSTEPTLLWDEGFVPGFHGGRPKSINNHGEIVGQAQIDSYTGTPLPTPGVPSGIAFRWDAEQGLAPLASPAEHQWFSEAVAINDRGQVAGNVSGNLDDAPHAVVWSPDGWVNLVPGCQEIYCRARDINDAGQVVGDVGTQGYDHAFFWDPVLGQLPIHPGTLAATTAWAINNDGVALAAGGFGSNGDPGGTYFWDPESFREYLLEPDGSPIKFPPTYMNDAGVVIGIGDQSAYVWSVDEGSRVLEDAIVNSAGWDRLLVKSINNRGQIVGSALYHNQRHGFVLTPVPEPGAAWLAIGAGCSTVAWLRIPFLRKRRQRV